MRECTSPGYLFEGLPSNKSSGTETALTLQQHLINYFIRELHDTTGEPLPSKEADRAIARAFLAMDRDIMNTAKQAVEEARLLADAISEVGAAYAGSCALMSYFNEESKELKVACTGDSRAVLGRKNAEGKWCV